MMYAVLLHVHVTVAVLLNLLKLLLADIITKIFFIPRAVSKSNLLTTVILIIWLQLVSSKTKVQILLCDYPGVLLILLVLQFTY